MLVYLGSVGSLELFTPFSLPIIDHGHRANRVNAIGLGLKQKKKAEGQGGCGPVFGFLSPRGNSNLLE